MTYGQGSLLEVEGVQLIQLLPPTAGPGYGGSAPSFSLMHWPAPPTSLTIRKESGEPEMDAAFLSCTNCLREFILCFLNFTTAARFLFPA